MAERGLISWEEDHNLVLQMSNVNKIFILAYLNFARTAQDMRSLVPIPESWKQAHENILNRF